MTQNSAPNLLLVSRPNPASDLTRVEDYLEVVYELIQRKGYARSIDIAQILDVKPPSVTTMLRRLDELGFIVYERYRGLALTDSGKRLARSVQQRHRTILKFLRILNIDDRIAQSDAEGIEHHVHKATMDRIDRFVDYAEQHPSWLQEEREASTGKTECKINSRNDSRDQGKQFDRASGEDY